MFEYSVCGKSSEKRQQAKESRNASYRVVCVFLMVIFNFDVCVFFCGGMFESVLGDSTSFCSASYFAGALISLLIT